MEAVGIFEDRYIAALRVDHLEEVRKSFAILKGSFGELVAGVRSFGLATEVDHPSGENKRELAEVFALGRTLATEKIDGFDDLNPVAGGAAQGLAHVGEKSDGAGSGRLGGGDHEGGEEFGVGEVRAGMRRSRF